LAQGSPCAAGRLPFAFMGCLPRKRRRCVGTTNKFEGLARSDLPPLERVAYTVPEFCFRNNISRPTYHRLRAEGRGPVEMRLGLNAIRISADAERDWQNRRTRPEGRGRCSQEQQARQQTARTEARIERARPAVSSARPGSVFTAPGECDEPWPTIPPGRRAHKRHGRPCIRHRGGAT